MTQVGAIAERLKMNVATNPFIEDQADHPENGSEPLGKCALRQELEGYPGPSEHPLRPNDALRQRWDGHEKSPRYLFCRQTAHQV